MKKPRIIVIFATLLVAAFSFVFFYLDYKKNPFNYIILSKKFEIVSYLFFRDLPVGKPPYENYYSINYERKSDVLELNDSFAKAEGNVSISNPLDTYKTGIPQKLRKLFNNYAKLDPHKKEDQEIIKNIIGTYGEDIAGRLANIISIYRYDDVVLKGGDLQKRIDEYINLFSKKFIVRSITKYYEDEQCGKNSYDIAIIFDSKPSRILDVALTNNDEICFILDRELVTFFKYDIEDLKEKYPNFWL
jgi:hypothetical protein